MEIGSEFNLSLGELDVKENNLFSYMQRYDTKWFDYGRSAIRYLSRLSHKKVLLPEFVCESVIHCFPVDKICFYQVNEKLEIQVEDLLMKIDETVGMVYVIHYFGYLQDENVIKKIRQYTNNYSIILVEDLTQSLFSEHNLFGDYGVASVRKWMPTPQGGVLFWKKGTKGSVDEELISKNQNNNRAYAMILKELYLSREYNTNKKYREMFIACEAQVDLQKEIMQMSDLSHYLISCVDVMDLISKRKCNAKRLREGMANIAIRGIKEFRNNECPLVYPVRVKNRDDFRKYLIEHQIYCAIHWPFDGVCAKERKNAEKNAETLISLPIDQRYGFKEIDYLINAIKKYGGELVF